MHVWRLDLATGYTLLFTSKDKAFAYADRLVPLEGQWVRTAGGHGSKVHKWIFVPGSGAVADPVTIFKQEVK